MIPSARQFEYKGAQLVAIPHRLDETRVLRNMGIHAPAPILHHYSWPLYQGRHEPFFAQRETSAFLSMNPRAYVLNDMGTGKTMATLWAFHYLRSLGVVRRMLVTCPLSTMERTWADEVFDSFPDLTCQVVYGPKERRQKILAQDADIFIINHHGMAVVEPELIAADFDVAVIDELGVFRNANTKLWKTANRIVQNRRYVWGLTGTPTPNAPTDAYAEVKLITPERVPKYYTKFRDMVMKQHGPFKWLPRETATEVVADAMQPAVRFTRDQCVDLPPTLPIYRNAPLTPEQSKAYKEMLSKLHMEFNGEQVQAVNEAVKLSKLVQIACGVVYDSAGAEVVLPNQPRIDVVKEIIQEAAAKVIVFVPYRSVLEYVADQLDDQLYGSGAMTEAEQVERVTRKLTTGKLGVVGRIHGGTSKAERDRAFHDFQHGDMPVLVAQPAAMSHGLTLTAANVVCWYAPVTSNDIFQQANARVSRPGQKHTTWIAMIEGSAVERKIYNRLQGRQKLQGLLLETLQGG